MSQRITRNEQTEYHQQNGGLLDADELRTRSDERPPLAHRTDRIALRNESNTPVVFVDDDPLFSVAPDDEHHYSTTLSLTTLEQHGPLTARWLEDHLDHPTLGCGVESVISTGLERDQPESSHRPRYGNPSGVQPHKGEHSHL